MTALSGEEVPAGAEHSVRTAQEREVAARRRLASITARRIESLQGALDRSLSPGDAATIGARLAGLRAWAQQDEDPSGSRFLALRRGLRVLSQALLQAESARSHTQREVREELLNVAALLRELIPERAAALCAMLQEVPAEKDMAQRLHALLLLVRTRQKVVPRLMNARPHWRPQDGREKK